MACSSGNGAAGLAPGAVPELAERLASHVLHDDVAGVAVLDEVVDLDDVRVFDLGQELAFGHRRRGRRLVLGVEQALQHDPHVAAAVGEVQVLGQIDPSETAVRDTAGHLVLTGHQVTWPQLRGEREPCPAVSAEPLGPTGAPLAGLTDATTTVGTETLALGDLGLAEDDRERITPGHRGHLDQSGAQVAPAPRAAGTTRAAHSRAVTGGRFERVRVGRRRSADGGNSSQADWQGLGRRRRAVRRRRRGLGGEPAPVAVTVLYHPGTLAAGANTGLSVSDARRGARRLGRGSQGRGDKWERRPTADVAEIAVDLARAPGSQACGHVGTPFCGEEIDRWYTVTRASASTRSHGAE